MMVTETQGHLFPGNLDKPDQRSQKPLFSGSKATFIRVQLSLKSPFSLFTVTFFRVKGLPKATFILL
jgi:hypothetical protein